jgi:hypothetical protein
MMAFSLRPNNVAMAIVRDGEKDVGHPHHHGVGGSAEEPGDGAERHADQQRQHGGEDADLERHPGAVDDPREDVPPDRVGTEDVVPRRRLAVHAGVELGVGVGGDPRGEDRHEHQQDDEGHPEHGQLVAPEALQDIGAQRRALDDIGEPVARRGVQSRRQRASVRLGHRHGATSFGRGKRCAVINSA